MIYRNSKKVVIIDQQGEVQSPRRVFFYFSSTFIKMVIWLGNAYYTHSLNLDSAKLWCSKKPKIKQEVGKIIFSFPHIFSSLKVFHIYYLERLDLKINLDFYLNSTVRRDDVFPQRLKWLELECCVSCNGDIFFLQVFLQTFCFYLICVKKYQAPVIWNNVA